MLISVYTVRRGLNLETNTDLKIYIENRLADYGYGKQMNPAKYNAYQGVYRIVMTRLGFISGGYNKIPSEMMGQAKKVVDEALPPIKEADMIDGYPRRTKLGLNSDWTLTRNACDTPMCTKRVNKTALIIMRRVSDYKMILDISSDPYVPKNKTRLVLNFMDWDSAAREADDVYRALMTTIVDHALAQISELPDV